MVKHSQRICRQKSTNCLSVFVHFDGLALKDLTHLYQCFTLFQSGLIFWSSKMEIFAKIVNSWKQFSQNIPSQSWRILGSIEIKGATRERNRSSVSVNSLMFHTNNFKKLHKKEPYEKYIKKIAYINNPFPHIEITWESVIPDWNAFGFCKVLYDIPIIPIR